MYLARVVLPDEEGPVMARMMDWGFGCDILDDDGGWREWIGYTEDYIFVELIHISVQMGILSLSSKAAMMLKDR
jgi:hypothetical protein